MIQSALDLPCSSFLYFGASTLNTLLAFVLAYMPGGIRGQACRLCDSLCRFCVSRLSVFQFQASALIHHEHHHPLCINTLKGHGDSVSGLAFTADARGLATGG